MHGVIVAVTAQDRALVSAAVSKLRRSSFPPLVGYGRPKAARVSSELGLHGFIGLHGFTGQVPGIRHSEGAWATEESGRILRLGRGSPKKDVKGDGKGVRWNAKYE